MVGKLRAAVPPSLPVDLFNTAMLLINRAGPFSLQMDTEMYAGGEVNNANQSGSQDYCCKSDKDKIAEMY